MTPAEALAELEALAGVVKRPPPWRLAADASRTHGMSNTRAYVAWMSMIQRCTNPKAQNWKWYGGRGIKICDRWCNSFEAFYADMGDPLPGLSIDRIDNDGNYELGNCRWATRAEQQANKRRREP